MRLTPTLSPLVIPAVLVAAGLLAAGELHHPVRAADVVGQEAPRAAVPRPSLAVTLVTPQAADWPREIEASGGLFAWQEGVIAAETGGLRVVAVTNISMVAVGSVIGIGGLGTWFTEGYQSDKSDQIIAGIIAIFLLAIIIDMLILLVGRAITPWARAQSRAKVAA